MEIGDHKLYFVARESPGRSTVSVVMEALSGPEPGRKFILKKSSARWVAETTVPLASVMGQYPDDMQRFW